jgi:hypothetical protein
MAAQVQIGMTYIVNGLTKKARPVGIFFKYQINFS